MLSSPVTTSLWSATMICRKCGGDKTENQYYPSEIKKQETGRRPRCIECAKLANPPEKTRKVANEWYARNREKVLETNRKVYERDRVKILGQKKEYYRRQEALGIKRRQTRESARRTELKMRYGITPEQYATKLNEQGGRCAICKEAPNKRMLCVDHKHSNDRVRGLLCTQCNFAVGFLEKGRDLQAVRDYIEHHDALEAREEMKVMNDFPTE